MTSHAALVARGWGKCCIVGCNDLIVDEKNKKLTIDKLGVVLGAADGFLMVISYNPGYQSALKDLKHSTRQRFVAVEFDFPSPELEMKIIKHESGCDNETAEQLAKLGDKVRNLGDYGLSEGASTRVLIYAGQLINEGVDARRACQCQCDECVKGIGL